MNIFKGWKTRIWAWAGVALGAIELLDPSLLTAALGLEQRGRAILFIVYALGVHILREMTNTAPGKQVK